MGTSAHTSSSTLLCLAPGLTAALCRSLSPVFPPSLSLGNASHLCVTCVCPPPSACVSLCAFPSPRLRATTGRGGRGCACTLFAACHVRTHTHLPVVCMCVCLSVCIVTCVLPAVRVVCVSCALVFCHLWYVVHTESTATP